jgi:formyltetrahydrofolate deformylase
MMRTAVLQLHCPDAKGIVYHVSKFIFEHDGNIIEAEQHTEQLGNRFFMRVVFSWDESRLSPEEWQSRLGGMAQALHMETSLTFPDVRKRLAVLVSKYDHCLYDLLWRVRNGEISADITFVASNHPTLQAAVEPLGIPYYYIPVRPETREAAEDALLGYCREHHVDAIVLARYMQVLSPKVVAAYRHKIINVHHGFLPAFQGAKPYHQAYERGVKLIGATSHYVTEELDQGPIIAQETVPVRHTHSVEDLIAMGRDIEKRVLAAAVKAHVEDRIMVYLRRTIVFE